jgi:elongation factor P
VNINDLKPGVVFEFEQEPWKVLKTTHVHMGRGSAVVQAKIKNVLNGRVQERAFRHRDTVKEADIESRKILYLYGHREQFWFSELDDRSKRFQLEEDVIGEASRFMKQNSEVEAVLYNGKIVGIQLPIKMKLKVIEAPPAIKGDTQGGVMKQVKIETGIYILAPIFVKEGDEIIINTEKGEYVERGSKP